MAAAYSAADAPPEYFLRTLTGVMPDADGSLLGGIPAAAYGTGPLHQPPSSGHDARRAMIISG